MDDLEGVSDHSDGLDFLAGVAAVELEGAHQSLDDGAGGLPEGLLLVATGSVGHEDVRLVRVHSDVVDEALVVDLSGSGHYLHTVVRPSREQLRGNFEGLLLLGLGDNFSHVAMNNIFIYYL